MQWLIRELGSKDISGAVDLAARSMCDNPLVFTAFGFDLDVRLEYLKRMFGLSFPRLLKIGTILGAFDGEKPVGIAAYTEPGHCQISGLEKIIMKVRIRSRLGKDNYVRFNRWRREWRQNDLREPHWHLGPVAVEPRMQRKGIGQALLSEYCARIDRAGMTGYLETDRSQNLKLYKKFGFETMREGPIIGIPNWFMRRLPSTNSSF